MAFSAVGAAMVCLPLWQVLQYQHSDLKQLAAQRALLDPVSQAVHVQFGLLAHRQVSGQLLRGQPQLEPARHAVQAGVDVQLQGLNHELAQGLWSNALAEARDLSRDWAHLAQRVKARELTAAQSDESHALRVEQALQVLDLVASAETVSGFTDTTATTGREPGSGLRMAQAARLLAHLASDLPQRAEMEPTRAPTGDADAAIAQARLLRRLAALQAALGQPHGAAQAQGPLSAPLATASLNTLQVLQVLQTPAAADLPPQQRQLRLDQAVQQAHQAQLALFVEARGQQLRWLTQRHSTLQRQQAALIAALAMLSAAALGLAAGLLRTWQTRQQQQKDAGASPHLAHGATSWAEQATTGLDGPFGDGPPPGRSAQPKVETGRLMDRLRSDRAALPPGHSTTTPEPQDTLPPKRG